MPALRGPVTDLAQLMDDEARLALSRRLIRFMQQKGPQIVVLTLPSLEGDPVEDFAERAFA
ncbi:MAG: TPM domain-containing protein, partial [Deltaproteobacteria bacterium]